MDWKALAWSLLLRLAEALIDRRRARREKRERGSGAQAKDPPDKPSRPSG
jgi:hypothetical protein